MPLIIKKQLLNLKPEGTFRVRNQLKNRLKKRSAEQDNKQYNAFL